MLQAGYDSRKGDFDQVITACDCPADLSTEVTLQWNQVYVLLLNLIFIYMVVHVWLSTWINHLHTN
jgi:hypothetical protein